MSSTLFKTVVAGAIAAGALLLPATAAQAAGNHHPCDEPGIGSDAFFGDGFGFHNDGIGFWDDGFGSWDRGLGFHGHRRHHDQTTVIVVTVPQKKHHHKPAAAPAADANGAGYQKPSATGNATGGYHKKA
jgi:hypothetical protein